MSAKATHGCRAEESDHYKLKEKGKNTNFNGSYKHLDQVIALTLRLFINKSKCYQLIIKCVHNVCLSVLFCGTLVLRM